MPGSTLKGGTPPGSVIVETENEIESGLGPLGCALAALIASRSVQSASVHRPSSVSAVELTVYAGPTCSPPPPSPAPPKAAANTAAFSLPEAGSSDGAPDVSFHETSSSAPGFGEEYERVATSGLFVPPAGSVYA